MRNLARESIKKYFLKNFPSLDYVRTVLNGRFLIEITESFNDEDLVGTRRWRTVLKNIAI